MAEHWKIAEFPFSAKAGPSMVGVLGPTATAKETVGSHATVFI